VAFPPFHGPGGVVFIEALFLEVKDAFVAEGEYGGDGVLFLGVFGVQEFTGFGVDVVCVVR